MKEKQKRTSIERYGVEHPSQSQEFQEKSKQTCLERYGAEYYLKTPDAKEKAKESNIKKYGVEFTSQLDFVKEKSKQTCLERYGVEYYAKTDEHKKRCKSTNLEKYGVENYAQTQEYKDKAKKINLERYGVENYYQSDEFKEKSKQTQNQRYGGYYSSTQEFKDKFGQTNIERYGQDSYSKTDEAKKRAVERSKWFGLLRQGIGDAIYVENLGNSIHLLECKICGQKFEYNTIGGERSRIHGGHVLCPECNPVGKSYSYVEKELLNFIFSIYPGPIQENTKSVIPPKELDIFLPEFKIAIEFNGVYYHSDLYKPDDYHKMKTELCEKQGVRLIHIFEDDWNFKQEIIKSILQTAISSQLNIRIQARKCEIREVNLKETNQFLEQNHIQGGILTQTVCYGLYCERKLVSLMSFKKSGRGFELQRYGILLGHTMIGGAEKLFKHFLKEYDPEFVITYADISLFTGKIYQKLGFTKVRRNKPNYMFVDGFIRIPKQSIRKLGQGYKRENDPYPRIYNCGIDKWEWKKPT